MLTDLCLKGVLTDLCLILYILGRMFTKTQLHVSAINVGHLQVVHEKTYQEAIPTSVGSLWGVVDARSRLSRRRARGLGLFRDRVKVTSMSTYSYV